MLKRLLAPILLVFTIILSSCNDGVDLSKFRLIYDGYVTFTDSNTQEVDAVVFSNLIEIDLKEDMEFHGSTLSALDNAYMVDFALEVEAPDNADFTFLKDVQLYLMADSLPITSFAKISNVPEAVKRFEIPVNSDQSLVSFLRNEKFRVRVLFNTRRTLSKDVRVKLTPEFMVHTR